MTTTEATPITLNCAAGERYGHKGLPLRGPLGRKCPNCEKYLHGVLCGVDNPCLTKANRGGLQSFPCYDLWKEVPADNKKGRKLTSSSEEDDVDSTQSSKKKVRKLTSSCHTSPDEVDDNAPSPSVEELYNRKRPAKKTTPKTTPELKRKNMKSEQWDRNYEDVLAFAKAHGHLKLPSTNPESLRLATWLRHQAGRVTILEYQKEKLKILSPYRDERSLEEKSWEAWYGMYKRLLAFYKAKGHSVVKINEDRKLNYWVIRQRHTAKKGKLFDERRRKKLEEINFEFESLVKYNEKSTYTAQQVYQWEQMYAQLESYHRVNCHCLVPYTFEENIPLGHWVSKQRIDFKKGVMKPGRYQRLDHLGFAWSRRSGYNGGNWVAPKMCS
jgi:hypothetical protein